MRDDRCVRTTLDLDLDILIAAREMASTRGTSMGKVVSDLVRQALAPAKTSRVRNGVPLLPRRPAGGTKPTMTLVNQLRDEA
jgi:hypothetical protein